MAFTRSGVRSPLSPPRFRSVTSSGSSSCTPQWQPRGNRVSTVPSSWPLTTGPQFSKRSTRSGRAIHKRTLVVAYLRFVELLDPFFREPPTMDEMAVKEFLVKEAAPKLCGLHDALARLNGPPRRLRRASTSGSPLGQPVRVALTGRTESPSLFEVLAILGRDASLGRLTRAATIADQNS